MNCRRGLPVPATTNGVLFSEAGRAQCVVREWNDESLTLRQVALVNKCGDDVCILEITMFDLSIIGFGRDRAAY
jgi:hypothetical protein